MDWQDVIEADDAVVIKTDDALHCRNNHYYVQMRNGWEAQPSNHWAELYAKMIEQELIPDNSGYSLTDRIIEHWQYWAFVPPTGRWEGPIRYMLL